MRVDQVLCAAGPVDAVTGQALAYRRLLGEWGWAGEDYAPVQAAGMPAGAVRPLHQLRAGRADAVVVHYSGYAPGLDRVLTQARRSLLVSHNITPAQYFWANDPVEAVRCELARTQLAAVGDDRGSSGRGVGVQRRRAAGAVGTRRGGDPGAVRPPRRARCRRVGGPGTPSALFVGRLVPHKRQDLVIRAFAAWHGRVPEARLTLVGTPLSAEFASSLHRLAEELAPGAVTFESGLSAAELWQRYRSAGVFLCLSEHEGFCIPLLEAFHFGVPVIARDAGAIGEVVDGAGVMLEAGDRLQTVAELLSLVTEDGELRAELAARGHRRLEAFARERTAATLRRTLEALPAPVRDDRAMSVRDTLGGLGLNRSMIVRRMIRLGHPRLRELRAEAMRGRGLRGRALGASVRWVESGVLRVPRATPAVWRLTCAICRSPMPTSARSPAATWRARCRRRWSAISAAAACSTTSAPTSASSRCWARTSPAWIPGGCTRLRRRPTTPRRSRPTPA